MTPMEQPIVRFLANGRRARLMARYRVLVADRLIEVPRGFVTDFASIPRFFQRLLPKLDAHIGASVVHDWLYRSGIVTRKDADDIFLSLMRRAGVGWLKRQAMYRAVRCFGWIGYRPNINLVRAKDLEYFRRRVAVYKEK